MKWGTVIPLMGNSAIGCSYASGNQPDFHLSYSPFEPNDKHIKHHWPEVPFYTLDQNDQIPAGTFEDVDYINSVCPCAGLSQLNRKPADSDIRAQKNVWMNESTQWILEHVKPKVLWGENAPNLFSESGEHIVNNLRQIAARYGYSFSLYKTNTELHGIPQKRPRTFYFFWNTQTAPIIDWFNEETSNFFDYILDIPVDASLQDVSLHSNAFDTRVDDIYKPYEFVLDKMGVNHTEFVRWVKKETMANFLHKHGLFDECQNWLRQYYPYRNYTSKPNDKTFITFIEQIKNKLAQGKNYWDNSPRFFYDQFDSLTGKNSFHTVHPIYNRYITIREMLHIMGMPHDFEPKGPVNWPLIKQIPQNVPTCTGKHMAQEVQKFCLGEKTLSNYSFVKQNNTKQEISYYEDFIKSRSDKTWVVNQLF